MLFSSHVLAMNVPKHARANSNMILYLPKPNNLTKSNAFFSIFFSGACFPPLMCWQWTLSTF